MHHRSIPIAIVSLLLVFCAFPEEENISFWDPEDSDEIAQNFDPNKLINSDEFEDSEALDQEQIQQFLLKTPYKRSSFLATYQSNGMRASKAIEEVAKRYHINPLVFLVESQVRQGLVSEEFYPSPKERVEYAFGCGCTDSGDCDPQRIGFEQQLDCFAGKLQESLSQITQDGKTAQGWGAEIAKKTEAGEGITPVNAHTAVLYHAYASEGFELNERASLFWKLWFKYTAFAGYK